MVRAVASRVVPRYRISKAMANEAAYEADHMKELAAKADAPSSVGKIPTRAGDDISSSSAVIRPMGNSRRVFLLDPHLKAEEIEGLAFRIKALSKNEGINSILIASDGHDDAATNCIPRYLTRASQPDFGGLSVDYPPAPNRTWHVSGGYDPLTVAGWMSEKDTAKERCQYLMDSLKSLALAAKGDHTETRVPLITLPHGAVNDSGYALCMGGYVLASPETSFQILNPSRGLSLDPVGFSYILPRLGREFKQRSSKYPGCGLIMALSGYEADCYDMVETGLATHTIDSPSVLPDLEYNLSALSPWEQQKLVAKPKHLYGQNPPRDANAKFRNQSLTYIIEQLAEYSANTDNRLPWDFSANTGQDPAFDTDHIPWDSAFFSSDLVDTAAVCDDIFQQETSLEGVIERLKEFAAKRQSRDISNTGEEEDVYRIVNELVERIERQSPLALRVIFQLMKMGSKDSATLDGCMDLEARAQMRLFGRHDFTEWAKHVKKNGGGEEMQTPAFEGWEHDNVAAVSAEEVDEILS